MPSLSVGRFYVPLSAEYRRDVFLSASGYLPQSYFELGFCGEPRRSAIRPRMCKYFIPAYRYLQLIQPISKYRATDPTTVVVPASCAPVAHCRDARCRVYRFVVENRIKGFMETSCVPDSKMENVLVNGLNNKTRAPVNAW